MKSGLLMRAGYISLFFTACGATPDGPDPKSDSAGEALGCKDHDDCAPEELCFFDGICAEPWGSSFALTKCSFEGPGEETSPDCSVHCMMRDLSSGTVQWFFSPQKWDECDYVNSLRAHKKGIEVRCGFVPEKDGAECPEIDSSSNLCISDGCPGFSIAHYRSDQFVELRHDSGYLLKFLLEPVEE